LKRATPSSQSTRVNLTQRMEDAASQDTWPLNRRIPINGYELVTALHNREFVMLNFWKLPVALLLVFDNVCDNILQLLQKELVSGAMHLNNEGLLAWARAILELLPSFTVVNTVDYEAAKCFSADVTYQNYKSAYYAYVSGWNWDDCHVPWVIGDGSCFFNSIIAMMTGRGVLNCPITARYKYVVGSHVLRLACICRQVVAVPYISSLSGSNLTEVQRRLASRCHVSSWCAEEEAAVLALLIGKPIQLMSPRWQQHFAPYGLFSSGSEIVDNSSTPIVIMWCKYVPNNSGLNVDMLHLPMFNSAELNHFVPCFVRPNAEIPRLKYMSTLKWDIVDMPASGSWKCPFFVMPLASSVREYADVHCPTRIGSIVQDWHLAVSAVLKPVWEEFSWQQLRRDSNIGAKVYKDAQTATPVCKTTCTMFEQVIDGKTTYTTFEKPVRSPRNSYKKQKYDVL
jgi:hypothetical protein